MVSLILFKYLTVLLAAPLSLRIQDAAIRARIDARLIEAIVTVESNFKPDAESPKGAQGIMQVMPRFSDECGIHSAFNPTDSLMGAADCIRRLINRYRGNIRLALAAYNAGPSQVDRYQGIPPFNETRRYVEKVLLTYQRLTNGKDRQSHYK